MQLDNEVDYQFSHDESVGRYVMMNRVKYAVFCSRNLEHENSLFLVLTKIFKNLKCESFAFFQ